MAKNWYPVIDYVECEECEECGTCVNKCKHGVYDVSKAPTSVVVNTESCIEGCRGCGNLCPNGAIQYIGDNSGWTPPNGEKKDDNSCYCGGNC